MQEKLKLVAVPDWVMETNCDQGSLDIQVVEILLLEGW